MAQGLSFRWQFIILNFSLSRLIFNFIWSESFFQLHFLYVPVPVPLIYLNNMHSYKVSDSGVFSVFFYEKDRLTTYCIKYAQLSYSLSTLNTNMKARPRSMLTLEIAIITEKLMIPILKFFGKLPRNDSIVTQSTIMILHFKPTASHVPAWEDQQPCCQQSNRPHGCAGTSSSLLEPDDTHINTYEHI